MDYDNTVLCDGCNESHDEVKEKEGVWLCAKCSCEHE
jgi:ribosomal protein L37AE/L43A